MIPRNIYSSFIPVSVYVYFLFVTVSTGYEVHFFREYFLGFSSGRGSFLLLSGAGRARGPRVYTAQVWTPGRGLCACSGGFIVAKNREVNYGVCFRRARACRDKRNPHNLILFFLGGGKIFASAAAAAAVSHSPAFQL